MFLTWLCNSPFSTYPTCWSSYDVSPVPLLNQFLSQLEASRKDNRKSSKPMISLEMMTNLKQVFSSEKKWLHITVNQERFTLAIDDTEEPRNGAKKNSDSSTSFWWSVWKTRREEKSITLEIEEYEQADMNRSLEKFYAEVKNENNLPALPPCQFF